MITGDSKFLVLDGNYGSIYPEIITLDNLYELFKKKLMNELLLQPDFVNMIEKIVQPGVQGEPVEQSSPHYTADEIKGIINKQG